VFDGDIYYKVRNKKCSYDLLKSVENGVRGDSDNYSLHTIQEDRDITSSLPCTPLHSQEMSDIPEYV